MAGESTFGKSTFPNIWIWICKVWIWIALGALVMVFVVWIDIMGQNLNVFQNTMGTYLGNDETRYPPSDPNNGYVNNTNIPKHLGGAVFAAAFDVAMMVIIIISACADLFWKFNFCKGILEMFFAVGLWGEGNITQIEYFFLIANAFLKLFIVAATGAQSYTGLKPDDPALRTPLFCLYATFILLGSIPFTVIASMFIIQRNKRSEWDEAAKKATAKPA